MFILSGSGGWVVGRFEAHYAWDGCRVEGAPSPYMTWYKKGPFGLTKILQVYSTKAIGTKAKGIQKT
jgi:hypothetical protein